MALKSYRLKDKVKRKKDRKRSDVGRIIVGGTTAILGVALFSEVARAIR